MTMMRVISCAAIALAGATTSAPAEAQCSVPALNNSLALSATYSHTSSLNANFRAIASPESRPNTNTSEDTQLEFMYCHDANIADLWGHYTMAEGDWNNNRGFSDPCNEQLMLARTFVGLAVLNYSSPTPPSNWDDMSGNALRWAGNYAAANIDELDGVCSWNGACSPGSCTWATTRTGGIFVDEWTRVYKGFVYQLTPYYRAATIFHESRHAGGKPHDGNDGANPCPAASSSCDEGFSDGTQAHANSYETWFAQWYLFESVNSTTTQKRSAQRSTNWNLSNRFDNTAGFIMQANSARQTCASAAVCNTTTPATII